jgi:2-methylisocitrate lyase-like PEP mutase family enzyme
VARCREQANALTDPGRVGPRLQRYQEAGAEVLFAPGVIEAADLFVWRRTTDLQLIVFAQY